jgi:hypothetical protein
MFDEGRIVELAAPEVIFHTAAEPRTRRFLSQVRWEEQLAMPEVSGAPLSGDHDGFRK